MERSVTDAMLISALCNILSNGLLRIRRSSAFGDMSSCKIEANHLHNIPSLIRDIAVGPLKYYTGEAVKS